MPLFLGAVLGLPGNMIIIMELTIVVSFSNVDWSTAVGFESFYGVPERQI